MKRFSYILIIIIISMITSTCGPGKLFGPTITLTSTRTRTPTSTPTITLTSTITPTSTLTPTTTPTLSPSPTPPQWLLQLSSNPIIPGTGLAGVKLGDTENQVTNALGNPSEYYTPADTGERNFYSMIYRYKRMFLGVYLNNLKTVMAFRILDDDFNKEGFIPNVKDISIGSTSSQLVLALGQPSSTFVHYTCPPLNGKTTTYYYSGISFWVCNSSYTVILIDIP